MNGGLYNMSSTVDILVRSILKSLGGSGDNCTDELDKLLEDIDTSMNKLAANCYDFNKRYDDYVYKNVKDATILKEQLKKQVITVSNDEIS